jgi:hypothetical protein
MQIRVGALWVFGFVLAILCSWCNEARAQTAGTITFTAQTTTGVGSVTPALSWSTTPAATGCTASGDWTGAKPSSGALTLPAITKSATYNLSCAWGKSTVTASWSPPTQNTDGSSLTDLAGFKLYWAGTGGSFSQSVPGAGVTTITVTPVPAGLYSFTVTALNANGVESDKTAPVAFTNTTASVSKSVGITVNAQPNPPSNVTVQ